MEHYEPACWHACAGSSKLQCLVQVVLGQALHQVDELLPSSSLPFDDIAAAFLLVFFGIKTLQVRTTQPEHSQSRCSLIARVCPLVSLAYLLPQELPSLSHCKRLKHQIGSSLLANTACCIVDGPCQPLCRTVASQAFKYHCEDAQSQSLIRRSMQC